MQMSRACFDVNLNFNGVLCVVWSKTILHCWNFGFNNEKEMQHSGCAGAPEASDQRSMMKRTAVKTEGHQLCWCPSILQSASALTFSLSSFLCAFLSSFFCSFLFCSHSLNFCWTKCNLHLNLHWNLLRTIIHTEMWIKKSEVKFFFFFRKWCVQI